MSYGRGTGVDGRVGRGRGGRSSELCGGESKTFGNVARGVYE